MNGSHLTVTNNRITDTDQASVTTAGPERPGQTGMRSRDETCLDAVLSALIERQVEAVLSGITVAALRSNPSGGDPDRPDWLTEDLQIAVRLTRLAITAGMVLPSELPISIADDRDPSRHTHLVRSRSRYQAIGEVFGRMMHEGTLPPECMPDAGRLLTDIRTQLSRIARPVGAPDDATVEPDTSANRHPDAPHRHDRHRHDWHRHGYLPGELLG